MTSLPVGVWLYIESSPEPMPIILLQPYKILERFHDKWRNYTNFQKGPGFFETPCSLHSNNNSEPRDVNDVKINYGSLQSDWTSALFSS